MTGGRLWKNTVSTYNKLMENLGMQSVSIDSSESDLQEDMETKIVNLKDGEMADDKKVEATTQDGIKLEDIMSTITEALKPVEQATSELEAIKTQYSNLKEQVSEMSETLQKSLETIQGNFSVLETKIEDATKDVQNVRTEVKERDVKLSKNLIQPIGNRSVEGKPDIQTEWETDLKSVEANIDLDNLR